MLLLFMLILIYGGDEMINKEELKELRIKKGLTQVEMAILIGVTGNTYRNWETGANLPSDENFEKLKEVLGLK